MYLNIICLLANKMAIHFDHTIVHGTTINICVQRGHGRTTWEVDNLGNCLSNSFVTIEGLKLLSFLTFELVFCQSSH